MGPKLHLVLTWIFSGQFFVNIDPQSRFVVGIHIPIAYFRQTGEHLIDMLREAAPFLNAKVGCPKIQMQVRSMTNR